MRNVPISYIMFVIIIEMSVAFRIFKQFHSNKF